MPNNLASLAASARARLLAAVASPLIQAEADDANVTVVLGAPVAVAVDGNNTVVSATFTRPKVVDGVTTTETINSLKFYYNRNPIGEFLTPQYSTAETPVLIPFNYTTVSTTNALIPLIAAHYGVTLLEEDIVLEAFSGIPTITATATSLGWTGTHTFPEYVAP